MRRTAGLAVRAFAGPTSTPAGPAASAAKAPPGLAAGAGRPVLSDGSTLKLTVAFGWLGSTSRGAATATGVDADESHVAGVAAGAAGAGVVARTTGSGAFVRATGSV